MGYWSDVASGCYVDDGGRLRDSDTNRFCSYPGGGPSYVVPKVQLQPGQYEITHPTPKIVNSLAELEIEVRKKVEELKYGDVLLPHHAPATFSVFDHEDYSVIIYFANDDTSEQLTISRSSYKRK